MNINLGTTLFEPMDTPGDYDTVNLQGDIDEHREIMAHAGVKLSESNPGVMLLADPDYPGAYRVWLRTPADVLGSGDTMPRWVWVNTEGEIVNSARPWGVK